MNLTNLAKFNEDVFSHKRKMSRWECEIMFLFLIKLCVMDEEVFVLSRSPSTFNV